MTTDRMSKMTIEEIYAYSSVDANLAAYKAIADQIKAAASNPQGTTMATPTKTPSTITNPVRHVWTTAVNVLPAQVQPYAPVIYGGAALVLFMLLKGNGRRRR